MTTAGAWVADLVRQLTSARQRGLANLDREPIDLTQLEGLARTYDRAGSDTRSRAVQRLIREALDSYQDGSPTEAAFIRSLFFDADGVAPIRPGGPSQLLDAVRANEHLSDRAFQRLQKRHFEDFARYLYGFVSEDLAAPGPEPAVVPDEASRGRRKFLLIGASAVVVIAAGVIIGVLASRSSPTKSGAASDPTSHPAASSSSASSPTGTVPVMFKFDTHGDPPFNVLVYPGPLPNATDRASNGDFPDKQEIKAVCVTTGRSITFTPDSGGASITSDQWVKIDAGIHTVQYATLAYGELVPSNARLPACTGVV
jgi:hypothetical protein